MHLYNPIPNCDNILTNILNMVIEDKTYIKYMRELKNSEKETDVKKAGSINKTIKNILVFNTSIQPLFLSNDVGTLLNISQINTKMRNFDPEEKVEGFIKKNNKEKKVLFLTKNGLYRCVFISKSPIARLCRKFFCEYIDNMIINEIETAKKISNEIIRNNKPLVNESIKYLENKLQEVEEKRLKEIKDLEIKLLNETKLKEESEKDRINVEIMNSFHNAYITQLKEEKEKYVEYIKKIKRDYEEEDAKSIENIELKLLKEQFMKPIYIYLLYPKHLKKIFSNKLKQLETKKKNDIHNSSDEQSESEDQLSDNKDLEINYSNIGIQNTSEKIKYMLEDSEYENNFNYIFNNGNINMDNDELLYFCFSFGRNIEKENKLISVSRQMVINKKHYNAVINSLKENSGYFNLNDYTLFKTTIDDIKGTIREELINILSLE